MFAACQRTPTFGIRPCRCARARRDHIAAVLPSNVTNSRRLMCDPSQRRLESLAALGLVCTALQRHERRQCDPLLSRQPNIEYIGPPLRKLDTVVLISPVWAHRVAGPMRSFIARFATRLRDIAVI